MSNTGRRFPFEPLALMAGLSIFLFVLSLKHQSLPWWGLIAGVLVVGFLAWMAWLEGVRARQVTQTGTPIILALIVLALASHPKFLPPLVQIVALSGLTIAVFWYTWLAFRRLS